jgi:hypothetical protein
MSPTIGFLNAKLKKVHTAQYCQSQVSSASCSTADTDTYH